MKKGIMPMSVGFKRLPVSIVRSWAIMLEIAKPQGPNRRQLQHKEVDPPPKDVSNVWAL
ncbi:hypothetical protein A2U01_0067279, partial [Trifolium medium]|nr:hypothetical protein [Trifolium medium]